jgi:TPP-dependent 2-oxoacid decarboxylase
MLGTFLSDVNLGIFTAHLDPKSSIYITSEKASIHLHNYEDVSLQAFMRGLVRANISRREFTASNALQNPAPFSIVKNQKITIERLFKCLNAFLSKDMIVISDIGDALFAGADLFIHDKTRFLSPAYYASLGFAVPAAIGAQFANPSLRPLVLVGDGAFQMTGMELSTAIRYGLNPIIILLNNGGYATERPMRDGFFNDVLLWRYSRIPDVLGAGLGFDITTEGELDNALAQSQSHPEHFCILDVHLDPKDTSPALKRLAAALGKKVGE